MNEELMNEMNHREALIKRIEKALKQVVQLECDHNIALGSLGEVLRDCRAALSRKYVPMTEADFDAVSARWDGSMPDDSEIYCWEKHIESEVIRRAGLEVQE